MLNFVVDSAYALSMPHKGSGGVLGRSHASQRFLDNAALEFQREVNIRRIDAANINSEQQLILLGITRVESVLLGTKRDLSRFDKLIHGMARDRNFRHWRTE